MWLAARPATRNVQQIRKIAGGNRDARASALYVKSGLKGVRCNVMNGARESEWV